MEEMEYAPILDLLKSLWVPFCLVLSGLGSNMQNIRTTKRKHGVRVRTSTVFSSSYSSSSCLYLSIPVSVISHHPYWYVVPILEEEKNEAQPYFCGQPARSMPSVHKLLIDLKENHQHYVRGSWYTSTNNCTRHSPELDHG